MSFKKRQPQAHQAGFLSRQAQKGYGMVLLLTFITSTILVGASMPMLVGPGAAQSLGKAAQDVWSAKGVAATGMEAVVADIQSRLNAGTTVDSSYTYGPVSVTMPQDPTALGGTTVTVGSYSATMTAARGDAYLVKVTATVGTVVTSLSRLVQMSRATVMPLDAMTAPNTAFGLRKVRSAYNGSAIRVRRSSDDTEQDIGFDAYGNLDMDSAITFLSEGVAYTTPTDQVYSLGGGTSATTAFSLRRVRNGWASASCIQVRRSSDSATQIIGFTPAGDLDVNALLAFVGNGTGYVTTWYDQTSNNRHATQATTTKQPTIVTNGVVNMINNRPAIKYDGVDDYLSFSRPVSDNFTLTAVYSVVAGLNTLDGDWWNHAAIIDNDFPNATDNDWSTAVDVSGNIYADTGPTENTLIVRSAAPNNDGRNHWMAVQRTKSDGRLALYSDDRMNAVAGDSGNSLNAQPTINIGCRPSSWCMSGYVNEVIAYASILSQTNLMRLKRNQSWYYRVTTPDFPSSPTLPMDAVTNTSETYKGAYGLRKLRALYGGSAIRVRRSSDNAEQDIGFTNGDLDVISLMSFVGSGTGYVKTWYDQSLSPGGSANGKDLTQATAANQPVIVNAGVLYLMNGKPSIYFTGANTHYLQNTGISITGSSMTGIAVFNVPAAAGGTYSRVLTTFAPGHTDWNYSDNSALIEAAVTNQTMQRGGIADCSGPFTYGDPIVATSLFDGWNYYMYQNGRQICTEAASGAFNVSTLRVGSTSANGASESTTGYISEVYLFSSGISSSNQAELEDNIQQYYSPPAPALYVTKWYDQSGNGNDAIQVNPLNQPILIMPWYGVDNGRPTVYFGGNQFLRATAGMPTSADYSKVAVASITKSGNQNLISGDSAGNHAWWQGGKNLYHGGADFATSTLGWNAYQNMAIAATFQQSNKTGFLYRKNIANGTGTTATSATNAGFLLGAYQRTSFLYGTVSEAMIFARVLSATDRTALYNDQVTYYGAN